MSLVPGSPEADKENAQHYDADTEQEDRQALSLQKGFTQIYHADNIRQFCNSQSQ